MKRKIVHIDEDKCTGCGICIPACHEGAIQIIAGKARLIAENLCDGLGDCLGECPEGAIIIVEREADPYDETAVQRHLQSRGEETEVSCPSCVVEKSLPCGSSSLIRSFDRPSSFEAGGEKAPSLLRQWPVQLALLPTGAKFFEGANLLVAADCVPFAYGDFHRTFLGEGTALCVGCPKLDDKKAYLEKLTKIIKDNDIQKVTAVIMEVPCCSGLKHLLELAAAGSGKQIPLEVVIIGTKGEILG